MKVAVTGAGGFIGSHLVEALVEAGADVSALVHYNSRADWGHLEQLPADMLARVNVVTGDVTDTFGVDQFVAGREIVFHLAALIGIPFSYTAPQSYVKVNVEGTMNILQACRRHRVNKLVHTSTSEVYGSAQQESIDEAHPLHAQSPYSASKIAADKLVESYHCSFGVPAVTARPFNSYGPRQSARALIPTVITQALSGDEVRLGSQDPIRDITFVTDTVRGLMGLALSTDTIGKTINLSSGRGISVGDIARAILRLLGSEAKIVVDTDRVRPPQSEVMRLEGNSTLAKNVIGWSPQVSLDEGLDRTIEYVRTNLHRYKPAFYTI